MQWQRLVELLEKLMIELEHYAAECQRCLERELAELAEHNEHLKTEIDKRESQLADAVRHNEHLEREIAERKSRLADSSERNKYLEEKLADSSERNKYLEEELVDFAERDQYRISATESESQVAELKEHNQRLKDDVSALEAECNLLRIGRNRLRKETQKLKAVLEQERRREAEVKSETTRRHRLKTETEAASDDSRYPPDTMEEPRLAPSQLDKVHFAVSSSPEMMPGECYVVDIWAFVEEQRRQVYEMVERAAKGAELCVTPAGSDVVQHGSVLTVQLRIDDIIDKTKVDTIKWIGEIENASFPVRVPDDARLGSRFGSAAVYLGSRRLAQVDFVVKIAARPSPPRPLPIKERRYDTAFASYAHEDLEEVLDCVHGMRKRDPNLDVFIDEHSLRSGERWKPRLEQEIRRRAIFYLFWSPAASRSEWVDWEWRFAFDEKGIDFIDPVPLAHPTVAPPPKELEVLQFNDWVLAYKRRVSDVESKR